MSTYEADMARLKQERRDGESVKGRLGPKMEGSRDMLDDELANARLNLLRLARHVMELSVDIQQAAERLDAAAYQFARLQERVERLEGVVNV